jgi:hypothetical protein
LAWTRIVRSAERGSSSVNLVQRWFATLTEMQLRRAVHRGTRELETEIRQSIEVMNDYAKPFVWTKNRDRRRRGSLLSSTFSTGH